MARGCVTGPPAEVAGELGRPGGDGHDALDRGAVWAIRQFLTDPAAADAAVVVDPDPDLVEPSRWLLAQRPHQPARPPHPPVGQPARPALTQSRRSRRSRCPTPARSRHQHEPPDHLAAIPEPTTGARQIGNRPVTKVAG